MNTPDDTSTPPLGFWLRTVDALLDRAFAEALSADGVSRRDWMLLNAIGGDVDAPWLAARLAHRGGRVRRLLERGWVAESADGLVLTDEGRAAKERLGASVDGIRARVRDAVSPDDFATTLASLEVIARELGWDGSTPVHRRHGKRPRPFGALPFGFAPGEFVPHGRGFGGRGHGHHGFGADPGRGLAAYGCDREHGPVDDTAFERGFTAGFEQGRRAASPASA